MRVLIINFEMDEDSGVLAWQASVARRIARHVEAVAVFTERLGHVRRPANMEIEVMPRRPLGIPRRLGSGWLINPQLFRLCRRFRPDVCFIHMAHEWSYRFAPVLRVLGIPVLMWYAHGSVPLGLRLSTLCATQCVTSTPEGFRLRTPKLRVIGQAIDTDLFRIPADRQPGQDIVYVGRVSRRKRIEHLIEAMAILHGSAAGKGIRLRIVGPMLTLDDLAYDRELRSSVYAKGLHDTVLFEGFMPQRFTPRLYRSAFLHLNVSETGSMDKTVMEALACGCPVLTSNPAFRAVLSGYPEFILDSSDPAIIAERIMSLYERRHGYDPQSLRALVAGHHDEEAYVEKILALLRDLAYPRGSVSESAVK
ncbi:MAG TPA: glycosyltransferase family 4 protein [Alphaproteobacteria bacterium]